MIVITNQYSPNIIEGIDQCKMMRESFERFHELAIITEPHKGNGNTLRLLYECYKRAATGHETFVFSDGGDTYCQHPVTDIPTNHILYSAESNCYPNPDLASKYPDANSIYKYLNAGGYCGPLPLIIEFIERYNLHKLPNGANGQLEQSEAFLKAFNEGFPIRLDYTCEVFQTTAFSHEGQFEIKGGLIFNKEFGTCPAILHANGRSPMGWIYEAGEVSRKERNAAIRKAISEPARKPVAKKKRK